MNCPGSNAETVPEIDGLARLVFDDLTADGDDPGVVGALDRCLFRGHLLGDQESSGGACRQRQEKTTPFHRGPPLRRGFFVETAAAPRSKTIPRTMRGIVPPPERVSRRSFSSSSWPRPGTPSGS